MPNEYLSQLFGLEGQTAVVVGGTGVLGGAICTGLSRAGAHVMVAGRSQARGDQRVADIQARGGKAQFQPVDVYDRTSIDRLLDQAIQPTGQVDILVNCAGVNASTPYAEISTQQWQAVIDGNLTATHLACQAFAPQMADQREGGSILNLGSVTAHLPLSQVFAYSAAKAAIVNLSKNLAREYASQGVRVNTLCPGFFPAEQNRQLLTEQRSQAIMSQTPMGRFGEPDELVGATLLLVSRSAGRFITGSEIYVDGGFTCMRF